MESHETEVVIEDVSAEFDNILTPLPTLDESNFSNNLSQSEMNEIQTVSDLESAVEEECVLRKVIMSSIASCPSGESSISNSTELPSQNQMTSSEMNEIQTVSDLESAIEEESISKTEMMSSIELHPSAECGNSNLSELSSQKQTMFSSNQTQHIEAGFTQKDVGIMEQQGVGSDDVGFANKNQATNDQTRSCDLYKTIDNLCKQIERSGKECSVLFLDKGAGNKNLLHSLGTSLGKEFLDRRKYILEEFILHCYGFGVKKILLPSQSMQACDDDEDDHDDNGDDDRMDDYDDNSWEDNSGMNISEISSPVQSKKKSGTSLKPLLSEIAGNKETLCSSNDSERTHNFGLRKRKLKIDEDEEPSVKKKKDDRTFEKAGDISSAKGKKGREQRKPRSKKEALRIDGKVKIELKKRINEKVKLNAANGKTEKKNVRKTKVKTEGGKTGKIKIKTEGGNTGKIKAGKNNVNGEKGSIKKNRSGDDGSTKKKNVKNVKVNAGKAMKGKKNSEKLIVNTDKVKAELQDGKKMIINEDGGKEGSIDEKNMEAEGIEGLKDGTYSDENTKIRNQSIDSNKICDVLKESRTESQGNSDENDSDQKEISTEETIFKCYTCMVCFLSENGLENHVRHSRHTGNEINFKDKERSYVPIKNQGSCKRLSWFKCTFCRLEMSSEENARLHVRKGTCVPYFQLTCRVCKKRFFKYNEYQLHIRKEGHFRRYDDVIADEVPAESATFYKCYTCDKYYVSLESLRRHMQATKHSGDKEQDGKREMIFITRKNGQKYQCSLCRLPFKNEELCQAHITKATCIRKYKRLCQLCNIHIYEGFNIYSAHMQELHCIDDPFAVVRIPKLPNPNHKKKPTDFICEQCGKAYQTKWHLEYHVKYHHRDKSLTDPDCTCDICGKVLATPYCKKIHMRDFHTDEKPFCCEICGYRAKTKSSLNFHHNAQHSVKKPFACDECAETFPSKQTWQRHKGRHLINRGSVEEASKYCKIYTCKECERKFVYKSEWDSHRLSHVNVEIKCEFCESLFKSRGAVLKHYKKVHKLTKEEMSRCTDNIPTDRELLKLNEESIESDREVPVVIKEESNVVERTIYLTVQDEFVTQDEIDTATNIVEQII
ncbi:hypothetical protein FSP39_015007 [Pinctada imbricata]|uniref:C2H2-type domain-containing protein n=1 Tax=Pinctada imbricata TaxID=66713 RepID=A0AA88YLS2_PINIB|nr:hypothetical protein FSP39_015007 [Pinctada imbricata]